MTTVDLSMIQAAKVVDARAMSCPGPLLEAKKSIGQVKIGEVLEILSGDANTKNLPSDTSSDIAKNQNSKCLLSFQRD